VAVWKKAGSGLWSDANNWLPTSVPNFGAVVVLDYSQLLSFPPYTVSITTDQRYSISSLSIDSVNPLPGAGITLSISHAILEVSGAFNNIGLTNTVSESLGSHFIGGTGTFASGTTSLNWTLSGSSTALFSGLVSGAGIHFKFADATADKITFGSQGIELFGSISQFGGKNSIDLTHLAYSINLSATYSGSLLILSDGPTKQFTFASFSFSGATVSDLRFADDGNGGTLLTVVCFAMGTRIAAENGDIAIEDLREGDRVVTLQEGKAVLQPVRWIGRRRLDLRNNPNAWAVAPVRIHASAFADGVPSCDLVVSPDHAVLVDGGLIPARQLINHMSICQETDRTSVEYFHVELDSHSILLAEGLPAESYLDTGNRGFFGNSNEPVQLHPDLSCAGFVTDEASVRPVWQMLHDRALASGFVREPAATTREADIRIVAGGREFLPVTNEAGRYVFALPAGSDTARLVSRHAAVTGTSPWLDDRRLLGVAIGHIRLRTADGVEDMPLDHPTLSQGWWDAERTGTTLQRWTDGDATIPLPGGSAIMLELVVAGTGTYSLAGEQVRRAA
jgi:hypothetical protein